MPKIINSLHSSYEIVLDKFCNAQNDTGSNKDVVLSLLQSATNLAIVEAINYLTDELYEIKKLKELGQN